MSQPVRCKPCGVGHEIKQELNLIGVPWSNVTTAFRAVFEGNITAMLTLSFMKPNNYVVEGDAVQNPCLAYTSVGMNEAQIIGQFLFAGQVIANLFIAMFSNTYSANTMTFTMPNRQNDQMALETGTSVPSSVYAAEYVMTTGDPSIDNVGDFRTAWVAIDNPSGTLAFCYSPGGTAGLLGDVGSDSRYDYSELWREDSAPISNTLSLGYVAVHELLHGYGLGHDNAANSVMRAYTSSSDSITTDFPNGLVDSDQYFTVLAAYAGVPNIVATNFNSQILRLSGVTIDSPKPTDSNQISGSLLSLGVAASGYLFGINSANKVYFRSGITTGTPYGTGFQLLDGSLYQLSTGAIIMAVTVAKAPCYRAGVTPSLPQGTAWVNFGDISCNSIACAPAAFNGYISVYAVNALKQAYFRSGVTFANPAGTAWILLNGSSIKQVVTSWFGRMTFCLNTSGSVYLRTGVTNALKQGSGWSKIASTAPPMRFIALSATNEFYGVGTDKKLYYRMGCTSLALGGTSWSEVNGVGPLRMVAIGLQK